MLLQHNRQAPAQEESRLEDVRLEVNMEPRPIPTALVAINKLSSINDMLGKDLNNPFFATLFAKQIESSEGETTFEWQFWRS